MKYIRIRYVSKETGEVRVSLRVPDWLGYGFALREAAEDMQRAKRPGEFTADFRKEVTYEED